MKEYCKQMRCKNLTGGVTLPAAAMCRLAIAGEPCCWDDEKVKKYLKPKAKMSDTYTRTVAK